MAGLSEVPHGNIPASAQFKAIANLRWWLFRNGFRRKGGKGELVARIIVFPFAVLFLLGPVLASAFGSYYAVSNGDLFFLSGVFWGIFTLQIIVSINISPPGLSFDPESLIRFPLNFSRYLTVRLFLGLLAASTVVGTFALLAAAVGITIAKPSLGLVAFAVAISLALCNMLFTRMLFAWVDRWLSTRRAREIFTGLIFAFSIGIQYVNVTFNGVGRHTSHAQRQAKIDAFLRVYNAIAPVLHRLPPGLGASAILHANAGQPFAAVLRVLLILVCAACFLAVFGWRMQREYRGENLGETSKQPAISPASRNATSHPVRATVQPLAVPASADNIPPVLRATLEKEWIYVRRNPSQLYGLLAPLAMVFIFAGRLGNFGKTGMIFPAAIAYSVLGVAALAYNILGLDANGVQFYFIAPIPMRSVVLAKNIFSFGIVALQTLLVYLLLVFTSGTPPLLITISTLCWVVLAGLVNTTIGNIRSLTAPKKIDPAKVSRKQASQLSALMSIGILLALAGLGFGLMSLSLFLSIAWLPIPILLVLAAVAGVLYTTGLRNVNGLAQRHRESLIEELSKVSA